MKRRNMSKLRITLEAARVNRGLTQPSAARKIGVSVQTLINWEKGRTVPAVNFALKLCEVYGVTMDDLIFLNSDANLIGSKL